MNILRQGRLSSAYSQPVCLSGNRQSIGAVFLTADNQTAFGGTGRDNFHFDFELFSVNVERNPLVFEEDLFLMPKRAAERF